VVEPRSPRRLPVPRRRRCTTRRDDRDSEASCGRHGRVRVTGESRSRSKSQAADSESIVVRPGRRLGRATDSDDASRQPPAAAGAQPEAARETVQLSWLGLRVRPGLGHSGRQSVHPARDAGALSCRPGLTSDGASASDWPRRPGALAAAWFRRRPAAAAAAAGPPGPRSESGSESGGSAARRSLASSVMLAAPGHELRPGRPSPTSS
jgi:hypothetical protein